jgi:hypothetical protein
MNYKFLVVYMGVKLSLRERMHTEESNNEVLREKFES